MNHTDFKQRLRAGLVLTGLLEGLLFAFLLYYRSRHEDGLGGEHTIELIRAMLGIMALIWLALLVLFFVGYRFVGVSREVWRYGRPKTAKDAPEDPKPAFTISMPMLTGAIPVVLVLGGILLIGGIIHGLKTELPSPFELLKQGSFEQLRDQLDDRPKQLEMKNASGESLLMVAIEMDAFEAAAYLIEKGADLEARNSRRETVVMLTAGNPQMLSLLLGKGALANVRGWNGRTPLHYAIAQQSAESVKLLLSYGVYVNPKSNDGRTPLMLALDEGCDVVGMLLSHGANPNLWNAFHEMPLHIAARKNDVAATRMLLMAGADKTAESNQGWTPLHVAALHGAVETAEVLLEFGLNVDIANQRSQTAMHCAIQNDDKAVINLLLEHGAEIDNVDAQGNTYLHHALLNEQFDVSTLLVQAGADIDASNDAGVIGRSLIEQTGAESLLDLLIE
ncbi:MAG: hypothetical protein HKP10_06390 [Kiritimatiellales bacterium]|nr:hypothetical protein [Kiritimatiellales bacterium]